MGYFETIGWSPSIGDPTVVGWLTVFAYLYTATVCFKVYAKRQKLFPTQVNRMSKLWLCFGFIFFLLAINKQLDLQSFFTQAMKYEALQQGWYEHRRAYQKLFILAIGAAAVFCAIGLASAYGQHLKSHFLAFFGISLLLGFVLIRAASFHNVDIWINTGTENFNFNHGIELLGIVLVAINARYLLRAVKKPFPRHLAY